jgi:ribonuclease PH
MRLLSRAPDEMRPLEMLPGYAKHAEGSCLVKFGNTHVLCTASLDPGVPGWLRGKGRGWVSAEYGMLPRATHERMAREAARGKQSGRTQEIQRLIGRSLRAVIDLAKLGERQILIDCDVLQADGGTRTAAISGAWVALRQCITRMQAQGLLAEDPILAQVGAVSCGIVEGTMLLDLDYSEDSNAQTDANFVLTHSAGLIEVQATAEGAPFSEEALLRLLRLARLGTEQIFALQRTVLGTV